jgi:hypothetical protein
MKDISDITQEKTPEWLTYGVKSKSNLPGIKIIRSLSSDNPKIQSASQYTQAWEILDLYHLAIQKSNLPVNTIYTGIANIRNLSSDNPGPNLHRLF